MKRTIEAVVIPKSQTHRTGSLSVPIRYIRHSVNGELTRATKEFAKKYNKLLKLNEQIASLEAFRTKLEADLKKIDPDFFETKYSLTGPRLPLEVWLGRRGGAAGTGPSTALRDAIIARSVRLSAREICKRLDLEGVPVPDAWTDVQDFAHAYELARYQNRLKKMISKVRSRSKSYPQTFLSQL
jgi:hypothetical protein